MRDEAGMTQGSLFPDPDAGLAERLARGEAPPGERHIFTIGHSTRPAEEFAALLERFGIRRLVDIRHFPRSRHNPQFDREALAGLLAGRGVEYVWLEALGGYRRGGYLAYMESEAFRRGIEKLEALAKGARTAYMCAELKWWRCHRRRVSDVLEERGWTVVHIMTASRVELHRHKENKIKCD